ncbi:MAG: 6,7-dimethyl-8-ribityllumazine synthase, partial [Bacteroidales bacterium]|nr:6,7-dimethyl-8-ribityllumazine synthase [Bacteroidales bacterium]MDE7072762.1 6,7-dimethyl-8-ribityllumazine synthase [Bacteroidales bacterium]
MATLNRISDQPLNSFSLNPDHRFVVLVAEWNTSVTHALRDGCVQTLRNAGVAQDHIRVVSVPGSFELSSAAAAFAARPDTDAVICLGCVIQGETRHFDFICQAVADGLTEVGIRYLKPTIFGVLTTNTLAQAEERAGGKLGNKGSEAAEAALQMLHILNIG